MEKQKELKLSSWENWSTKVKTNIVFSDQELIIQSLSGKEWDEVQTIPLPIAPETYVKDSKGKPVKDSNGDFIKEKNTEDELYKKELESYTKARTIKILEYGLKEPNGKEIPGNSIEEKWEFLANGVAGNIIRIANEILKISNLLPGEVDFFGLG